MEKENLEKILNIIKDFSGLSFNPVQKHYMEDFLNIRINEFNMDIEEYTEYIEKNRTEFSNLINYATINETYFFREESQFEFLKEKIFPSAAGKTLTIWSAACSTGEEPYSLLALSQSMGLNARIFATDINTLALEKLRKGIYTKRSFKQDGKKFHDLLNLIGKESKDQFVVNPDSAEKINSLYLNLNQDSYLPFTNMSVDIILLRNTFIYFEKNKQVEILKKLQKILKPEGILLLGTSEIPALDFSNSDYLKKESYKDVYYLKKT